MIDWMMTRANQVNIAFKGAFALKFCAFLLLTLL
jgi:hypothetical protein